MNTTEDSLALTHARPFLLAALRHAAVSPRLYVYVSCTIVAVLTSYHLGKEMLWDTMDYHVYAGFSALHDRFGQDYFAASSQGYFNPYAYVPFYLLLRSSLTPVVDASILAALQSGILWLTYELAMAAAPRDEPRTRLVVGMLAVVLAIANPVLINELGSSFTDITTAEVALAGWALLLTAIRTPAAARVVCGALLLGAASALKPTNAVHAVSAAPILLFVPSHWRTKLRYAVLFAAGLGAGFAVVSAPWSLRLEEHFGNPVFPLLNGLFRSPEFATAPMVNYDLIPASFGAALLRPFAIAVPRGMVHVEWVAPDVRYALLLVLTLLLPLRRVWRRRRQTETTAPSVEHAAATRVLVALGCGFLLDWTLWLAVSGNSRYFMPMACVAAVLVVAFVFRLFTERPAVRNYLLAAVFGVQLFQLCAGTEYRPPLPWQHGPWFSLTIPTKLATQSDLYFLVGDQTNSFIIPYLPKDSGFINLDGEYVLGPNGPNGARIESMIRRFAPNLQALMRDPRLTSDQGVPLSDLQYLSNALEPFGLKVDADRCSSIIARGVTVPYIISSTSGAPRQRPVTARYTEYLVTCHVVWNGLDRAVLLPGQRAADLAFDHLEDACPVVFQPRRPADSFLGDPAHGYVFVRRYANTDTVAWIGRGWVRFQNPIGGVREQGLGAESAWEKAPFPVACSREGFLRLLEQPR